MLTVIKNYWILVLLSFGALYIFIESGSYPHLIFAISTLILILLISRSKNEKRNRLIIGIYLLLLVVWQIAEMIVKGETELYKLILSISFSIISIILITNSNQKVTELRGNSMIQSIVMLVLSSSVCYAFIQSAPYDFLELITIIITAVFSVVLSWFLFHDLIKNN